jgi:hypothetical protein
MVKGKLREEGYDPDRSSDPLYVMKPAASNISRWTANSPPP